MTDESPIVYVVDDDAAMRKSISALLETVDHRFETFDSAAAFLEQFDPDVPGCLVVDIRMPQMTGLALIKELEQRGSSLPAIVITAYGDVPTAVDAMKNGAIDFLEKPFNGSVFLERVQQAVEQGRRASRQRQSAERLQEQLDGLSRRERQVLAMLVDGMLNKQIAQKLGLSEKTVSAHRTRLQEKMHVTTIVELVQLIDRYKLKVPRVSS